MNRSTLVIDTEVTAFGRHTGHGLVDCAANVAACLLRRHPQLAARIDLVVLGSARPGRSDGRENGLAASVAERLGVSTPSALDVRAFCASGNVAVETAVTAIDAGRASVALVIGADHLLHSQVSGPLVPEANPEAGLLGYSPPVFYGLCADRYLREWCLPAEALAEIAVHNRRHAADNERAMYREPLTAAGVLASRAVASPLTKLMCCPSADGAGAALVVAEDAAGPDAIAHGLAVRGMGEGTNTELDTCQLLSFREDRDSAGRAFGEAGVSPSDIDVVEVHDAFTISQAIHLEDIGIAPPGMGWRHATAPEDFPVINPNGGLLSRGHPLGATGLAQFDSMLRYVRGSKAAHRPRWALIQEAGGLEVLGQLLSTTFVLESCA